MAEASENDSTASTSPSKSDGPEEVHLIMRTYYDSLCKLIQAAGPQYVSNKLYTKGLVTGAAHRALDTLGVSKDRQAANVVDAFMLNLEANSAREKQLAVLKPVLDVLASVSNPCRQKANEIAIAVGCPQPIVTCPSPPISPSKDAPCDTFACNYQNVISKLKEVKFPETHWRPLGTALKLREERLDSIAADRRADNPASQENALLGLLSKWLRQDFGSTWEKLATALEVLGYTDLSVESKKVEGVELNVSNIQEWFAEIDFEAYEWRQLGIALGMKSGALKTISATYEGNLVHAYSLALVDVVDKWLRSERKPTWEKLAKAMIQIRLPKIARQLHVPA